MNELHKIGALWQREVIRYWREKSRIVSSLILPLLWLLVFGGGMRNVQLPGVDNYQMFIFPGILGMTLLFISVWSGVSIIWDREFGFLKEIMVAPVSRTSIVIGKTLGSGTAALIQGFILLPLSLLIGVRLEPVCVLLLIPIMIIMAIGLVCVGLLIASMMSSMEGFNFIMSLVIMPMFFTSGALFPMASAPEWLRIAAYANPLAYGVDLLRWATDFSSATILPVPAELAALLGFGAAMIAACTYTFSIKK
jgi:ABC-2 type transport system permease protein